MHAIDEDTLTLLRDAARGFCQEHEGRSALTPADAARFWGELAALGWFGVAVPESYGGSATGLVAAGVIAAELGRAGHTRGYAETVACVAALLRGGLAAQEVRSVIMDAAQGRLQLSFLRPFSEPAAGDLQGHDTGGDGWMPDAGAERLGVLDWSEQRGLVLHTLDAEARSRTVRTTSRAGDIEWRPSRAGSAGTPLAEGAQARRIWQDASLLYRCLASAQLVAATQAALATSKDYALVRSQFGHLIGSYQAVQHALVDMLAATDAAELLVLRALSAIDAAAADQVALAAAAVCFARETAWSGLMKTYDVLGGVGFIEEHPINRLTRAVLPVIASIGSAAECDDAVAAYVRPGHWLPQGRERTES